MNFQVGDRVVFVRNGESNLRFYDNKPSIGRTGTVCNADPGNYPPVGVAWDDVVACGHTCNDPFNNRCEYGHGWFVFKDEIQIIFDTNDDLSHVDKAVEDII